MLSLNNRYISIMSSSHCSWDWANAQHTTAGTRRDATTDVLLVVAPGLPTYGAMRIWRTPDRATHLQTDRTAVTTRYKIRYEGE